MTSLLLAQDHPTRDVRWDEVIQFGIVAALALAALLPAGLLLWSRFPGAVARCRRASDRSRVASALVGAAVVLVLFLVFAASVQHRRTVWFAAMTVVVACCAALPGLCADAQRTGSRMGLGEGARAHTVGWLTRAGSVMLPVVSVPLLAYHLASALGAGVLALFSGKDTTDPSAGSTPSN